MSVNFPCSPNLRTLKSYRNQNPPRLCLRACRRRVGAPSPNIPMVHLRHIETGYNIIVFARSRGRAADLFVPRSRSQGPFSGATFAWPAYTNRLQKLSSSSLRLQAPGSSNRSSSAPATAPSPSSSSNPYAQMRKPFNSADNSAEMPPKF